MVIENFGDVAQLKLKEVPTPTPQDHEVLIQIEYAAVNPVDWKIREGMLRSRLPHKFPLIPGWDASGTIKAIGRNVRNFHVGDQIFAYCRKPVVKDGTYAEFITFDAAHIALKPKNISFAEAASIPLAALAAWQALFDFAHLKPKQSVLIHAGAGGVGSFAIQFAKNAKADVWTTCSPKNFDYVKSLGADHCIDYTKGSFTEGLKKQNPQGFDLIFDMVGGKNLAESYALVKPGGTLVSIVEMPSQEIAEKNKIRSGFVFVRPDGHNLSHIAKLIESGKVKPPQIQEFQLKDAAKAQELSKEGHICGKIVLKIR